MSQAGALENWMRLSKEGTFGPPSHDLVTVDRRWQPPGKREVLTLEELHRQPGWLVIDAQPYVEAFYPNTKRAGMMDVWIAADGRTLRRQKIYDSRDGSSRALHDYELTYELTAGSVYRSHVLTDGSYLGGHVLAVPVGEPPRTFVEKKFLSRPRTTGLRDTIQLTYDRSTGEGTKDHDLRTAMRVLAQRHGVPGAATL